jgi:hypothetical protein
MHVCLGALDVVVQVIPEELDVRDGGRRGCGVGEVAGEQHEGHVACIIGVSEVW